MVKFGPAGNCQMFHDMGYKNTFEMPDFLNKIGLDAYEIQCGRGVRMKTESAIEIGKRAKNHGISLSVHAPYYISMSGTEEEKRLKSIDYILQSAELASKCGATRIVVHSGSCSKISREYALELALDTMKKAVEAMDSNGYQNISICPETMGKVNQLGTLDEVIALCKVDERIIPTIDFGHLNARDQGVLKTAKDFENVVLKLKNELGEYRFKNFHVHFSKIEYSAGGEKKHLTFEDTVFGPNFEPFAEVIYKHSLEPTIICESDNTMSKDALYMKNYYNSLVRAI